MEVIVLNHVTVIPSGQISSFQAVVRDALQLMDKNKQGLDPLNDIQAQLLSQLHQRTARNR